MLIIFLPSHFPFPNTKFVDLKCNPFAFLTLNKELSSLRLVFYTFLDASHSHSLPHTFHLRLLSSFTFLILTPTPYLIVATINAFIYLHLL
jgi:hypothetical protein